MGGGVIVRGTPFRHAFPSRTLLLLPTPPPPSDASSASRCVFRSATRLTPPDLSPAPASRSMSHLPRYVSSPAAYLVSCGMTRLPRYNLSPVVQLVSHSSRFGSSPLPTSRGITRHHVTSCNIMQHTVTSRNPRGTPHLLLAFRSRPGCPATSQDIPRLPSHPWDIPRLPGIP